MDTGLRPLFNINFNFERLFFSNQSATNFRDSPWKSAVFFTRFGVNREMTYFTRTRRSYFRFAPPPSPRDKTASNNSPPPGLKGWTCPRGCPGGMVTGKIEPCISNQMSLFLLSSLTFIVWGCQEPILRFFFPNFCRMWDNKFQLFLKFLRSGKFLFICQMYF